MDPDPAKGNVPAGKFEEKIAKNTYFVFSKPLKKGVGSGVGIGSGAKSGSGSISQRYGSSDPDTGTHQNVTDPQHCLKPAI
jgi:hypothetical protein